MTTKYSPSNILIEQARMIVKNLKLHAGQIPGKANIKFAVVQDDKLISIDWLWEFIDNTNEQTLIGLIVMEMRK